MPYRWTTEICPTCGGYGWDADDDERPCAECKGNVEVPRREWFATFDLGIAPLAGMTLYRTRKEARAAIERRGNGLE